MSFIVGTGILTIALVTLIAWPRIRGRGLLLTALALRLVGTVGYVAMHFLGIARDWDPSVVSVEVVQVCSMLCQLIMLVGDGLLLLALISLANALRGIHLGGVLTNTAPFGPLPEKL